MAPRVTHVAALFNPGAAPYIVSYLDALNAVAPSFAIEVAAAPGARQVRAGTGHRGTRA